MYENEFGILVREDGDPSPDLDRLTGVFEQTLWSAGQARMILAGIHPESTGECRDSHGSSFQYVTLPGVLKQHSCQTTDDIDFHRNIQGDLDYLSGFIMGESQSPTYWVNKALEKGYEAPWLETAINSGFLPEAKNRAETDAEYRKLGGLTRHRNSYQGEFKLVVLVAWDRQFSNRKHCGETELKREVLKFIRAHTNQFFDLMPIERSGTKQPGVRTIGDWVSDMKKDLFEGKPTEWISRYRADPQYEIVQKNTCIKEMLQSAKQAAS